MQFPPFSLIVTAAGTSERFRNSSPDGTGKKEFALLDDRSVLYHAILPFTSVPSLRQIIVTYPENMKDECELALDNLLYAFQVPVFLVPGGKNRQESVRNALEHLEGYENAGEYVAIHDGARPFVSPDLIIRTIATATVVGGAIPGITIHDAVKRVDEGGFIVGPVDRTGLTAVQTPQVFRFPDILTCHKAATDAQKIYVDDSEIFTDHGYRVAICEGDPDNFKITTQEDLDLGRKMV